MKLLIVDDERHIVNYLKTILSEHFTEDLEIKFAYSGMDALSILKESQIDLIILDIHMPGITGLELAKTVANAWPRCKIIFLTAFDNFNYIYQATELAQTSYLLKTEPDSVIIQTVEKSIALIKSEQENLFIQNEVYQKNRLLTHLLQQNILREMVSGSPESLLSQEIAMLGTDCLLRLDSPFYLMYMQVRQKKYSDCHQNISMQTLPYLILASKLLEPNFTFAVLEFGKGSYLWVFQACVRTDSINLPSDFTLLKAMADELSSFSTTTFKRNAVLILHPCAIAYPQICQTLPLLKQRADTHLFSSLSFSSVIVSDKIETSKEQEGTVLERNHIDNELQELNFHLYQGNQKNYFDCLDSIRQICCTISSMHHLSTIKIYHTISLMLLNYIDIYKLQESLAEQIAIYPLYYLNDFHNWDEAYQYLLKCSSYIFQLGVKKTEDKTDAIITRLKDYIQTHLSESLNLSTLSTIVNYNETYISRLFRQHTGNKLSDYIYSQRISKAKNLLSATSDSMIRIAATTGFDSAQYFSLAFKKATGMSPSEYRRLHYNVTT